MQWFNTGRQKQSLSPFKSQTNIKKSFFLPSALIILASGGSKVAGGVSAVAVVADWEISSGSGSNFLFSPIKIGVDDRVEQILSPSDVKWIEVEIDCQETGFIDCLQDQTYL